MIGIDMIRAMEAGLAGIQNRAESFNRAAERIARPPGDDGIVTDVVQSIVDSHGVAANVATIRAADEMYQSLFHVIA